MTVGRGVSTSLDGVRDKNIMHLKKLNVALFPVHYNDKYYADALASGDFSKLGSITVSHFNLFSYFFIFILVGFLILACYFCCCFIPHFQTFCNYIYFLIAYAY
ncbi:putative methionine N(alpha)-acetyltransferase NatB [Lupinus albus]|uniref:Putative methionine N(Alpha)-acetyltransferase NatB n=1 Tax=Lupinus albus TaxID=3870 RepID=A0A6A4QN06_LUPAL|nr:putative methionine N(alpha)-acetyltransferase NatB [Lupinus albus]